jgi:hypothetical protein
MRKKLEHERHQRCSDRLEKSPQDRRDQAFVEDKALDEAVRRSIKQFGA